jgi:pyridoxal phosphate enzyme (YggS family)
MSLLSERIAFFKNELLPYNATLIAVSKTKPASMIQDAMDCNQLHFGENYVQELVEKNKHLIVKPEWHFIGHLQSNKVKQIAPFITLIQTVDNAKLLSEINKQAIKNNRTVDCLLQIYIAKEETKFGLSMEECDTLLETEQLKNFKNIRLRGLMGMATNTHDMQQIRNEFRSLFTYFNSIQDHFTINEKPILSMGMTADYKIALDEGSTMIRIGSAIFGNRQ